MSDERNPTESGGVNSTSGPGGRPTGPDGELELRSLFQGAVSGLEPSDGALERLRYAVPARRARKRQAALVGVAAAALLVGVTVPTLFNVASGGGSSDDHTAIAGHGETAEDGESGEGGLTDPDLTWPTLPSTASHPQQPGKLGNGPGQPKGGKTTAGPGKTAGTGDGNGPGGRPVSADPVPVCQADQLGVALEDTRSPDADGKVYGTFRITNVSQAGCKVTGRGTVTAAATGAADPAHITVADHTAGDPAGGLPSPSENEESLVLPPNAAYEIKFAWVPAPTCPGPGPTPTPEPTHGTGGETTGGTTEPGDTAGTGTGTGDTEGGEGAEDDDTDPLGEGQQPDPGAGVEVTHTAEPGAPTARTVIPNACAGTLYRTGVLPAEPAS
ncbi:hypothetical protein LG634_36285 [Streptomyces bambusae]|uniref:hypothetical protein n=1 Tax=Streptomyces bambusae TaxID=1550616 RepID=UPI001D00009F|nr:hypothetical protein [Streptomyces bambusae]MCB5170245.1 hypothetical protein [Streptomyces bambusae]